MKKKIVNPCDKNDNCQTLVIEETEYRTLLNNRFLNRKIWKAPDPKMIFSVIPGRILTVYVKEGQKLNTGDPLVILEAMKMRNVVRMPADGSVKKINVEEGSIIPKGHLILEID